jgi:hypothetical protein
MVVFRVAYVSAAEIVAASPGFLDDPHERGRGSFVVDKFKAVALNRIENVFPCLRRSRSKQLTRFDRVGPRIVFYFKADNPYRVFANVVNPFRSADCIHVPELRLEVFPLVLVQSLQVLELCFHLRTGPL